MGTIVGVISLTILQLGAVTG
jgi:hypothetical protein